MNQQTNSSNVATIIITSIISIIVTTLIGFILISIYGTEKVASEVSPFVETARNTIAPSAELATPQTEADQIMDGVATNQGSSVLIYSEAGEFLGRGVIVTSNGYIITDASIINASSTYSVTVPGTKDTFTTTFVTFDGDIALLKIKHTTTIVARFGNNLPVANDLVVAINGNEKMSIGTGIISTITDTEINTNIYGSITPGALLVAKSGFALGISLAGNQKPGEPSFKILTERYINSLTAAVDAQ